MSYEGYTQYICENGHHATVDCYEDDANYGFCNDEPKEWKCGYCGAPAAWRNMVDHTNCCVNPCAYGKTPVEIAETCGTFGHGYVQLEVAKDAVECHCNSCGNEHTSVPTVYEIPGRMDKLVAPDGTSFAISSFVRRQTKSSEFSYFAGTDEELLTRVSTGVFKQGYRDGVELVSVSPDKFYSSTIQLKEGDELVGTFKARREGELPVREIRAVRGEKLPAKKVEVVVYRHDVLAENNEQSSDADWEIISINASPTSEEVPISVGALMRNFFCEEGGTDTKMSADEFVEALKKSREYWRDKALLKGK